MNYMDDSSQPTIVPSLGGMLRRDPSLLPDNWNLSVTTKNVFESPRAVIDSSSTPCQRYASLFESK